MLTNLDDFKSDLRNLINSHSVDNDLQIPDYILTEYVLNMICSLKKLHLDVECHSGPFDSKSQILLEQGIPHVR